MTAQNQSYGYDGFGNMTNKTVTVLATIFGIVGCFGQASIADQHVKQLIAHWQWKQYWDGTTELGAMYGAGRQFQAVLFWRTDEMPPSVGFCSADLLVCQFYPDIMFTDDCFEMKVPSGENLQSAFQDFLADSLGQKLLVRSEEPKAGDYTTEIMRITLPPLDLPDAIRDRKAQPRAETDALIASLSCLPEEPGCKIHLLIPFYSHSDPWVPVFTECSKCLKPKPMIIYMRLIEGHWWHGVLDYNDSPDIVARTRNRIAKALMVEVNR